ncbi:Mu-like prophage major head subunit gpT family protein [Hydrogenimonas urashimensis]|uniref:phage major capsid protein n=1 Tax=Hydrogenimonas urashimensis TaxID=2740515 RepID=UPI0019155BBD|nr:Mu-like prophage major head subunit gpT family protein [Hydrogenimonas urashimensis]
MPRRKLNAEKIVGGTLNRRAAIDKTAIDTETRRVSILISTETPIRRTDWWSGEKYDEVLLHGEENIDLTRAGSAKLRWMHGSGRYGELPIGRLENVRLENRELRADAVFSTVNPDADMLWRMVEEGTLTEISVGGVKREVRITERDGDVPLVEVTRWEFQEASLVDIGADPSASIGRKQQEGETMDKIEELKRQLAALRKGGADAEAIERKMDEITRAIEAIGGDLAAFKKENADLKRRDEIKSLASKHGDILTEEELQRFLDYENKSADDLARYLLDRQSAKDVSPGHMQGVQVGDDSKKEEIMRAATDALIIRSGVKLDNPHDGSREFMAANLSDIMRAVTGYDGYSRDEMIKRAMSTSDFPVLLGNVANRVLSAAYEEAEGTFDIWTASTELPDFKTRTEASRGRLAGRLRKLTEYGETKKKESKENSESWRLYSYGDEVTLSREMIINDDLGAFTDLVQDFARMAKRTANGLVYDLLQKKGEFASYKMADGKPIFDAAHNNVAASGAQPSIDTLTQGRIKMRRQKDAAGTALNINPRYIIAAPENETLVRQLLTSEAAMGQDNPGVVNPFRGALDIVVDAELDADPWYLAASRRTIKVGYLAGTGRRPIVAEKERNLRYVTYECVFDFGLFAEDFRGLYKNAGA